MTRHQLAYDDSDTVAEMWSDARRCGARLRGLERAAGRATGPTSGFGRIGAPRTVVKPDTTIDAAAVRLAEGLSLHLG